MENNQPTIITRPMQPGEEKAVLSIMRRAFPVFMRLTFSAAMVRSAEQVLVACVDGDIKGGTLLKTFDLPKNGKGGVVDWIFTDPSGRGLGLGNRLMDASMDWFNQAGCEQSFAIVEGFNTNSSNLFARRGFSILTFNEQVQRFGIPGIIKVWLKTLHFFDLGHFLWGKPAQKTSESPSVQLASALLLNMIIALLAGLRSSRASAGWDALTILPLWVLTLMILRNGLMALSARLQGLSLRYRLWETGFVISTIVMLMGGAFIPIPGSYYPNDDIWNYHQLIPKYGKTALFGTLPALLIAAALFLLSNVVNPSGVMEILLSTGYSMALVFSVVDILIPFFPLISYNGRRIWDWNRWIWGIMAALTIALWLLILNRP